MTLSRHHDKLRFCNMLLWPQPRYKALFSFQYSLSGLASFQLKLFFLSETPYILIIFYFLRCRDNALHVFWCMTFSFEDCLYLIYVLSSICFWFDITSMNDAFIPRIMHAFSGNFIWSLYSSILDVVYTTFKIFENKNATLIVTFSCNN